MPVEKSARDLVLSHVEALNGENLKLARHHVNDDMRFDGALASCREPRRFSLNSKRMRLKYDIKKVVVDGNDVCILYDVTLSGAALFTCGWYQVEEGKIRSLKVVFDPRPVLDPKAA